MSSRARSLAAVRGRAPWPRIAALAAIIGLDLVAAAPAAASVFAWREAATLHLTNDPDAVPARIAVRRFEARPPRAAAASDQATSSARTPAVATPPPCPPAPPWPTRERAASGWSAAWPGPIVVAPTVVVRFSAASPTIVAAAAPSPWLIPSGFFGHEHPQIGFLAGRRLVPHSHFFARGRVGRFTPWGHFTSHGVLSEGISIF